VLSGGLLLCCSEQMEELRRLQIQSEEEAQTLRQVAEEAGNVSSAGTDRLLWSTDMPYLWLQSGGWTERATRFESSRRRVCVAEL
jgi:hypothetical protein